MPDDRKKTTAPKASPRDALDAELSTIFGKKADKAEMSTLEQSRDSWVRHLLVGMVALFGILAAVSWAGFFFFSGANDKFDLERVKLQIDGDIGVTNGKPTTYTITWKNEERVPLAAASLELHVPSSFAVRATEPSSTDLTWKIGSIDAGKEGSVSVTGVMLAPLNKDVDFQAILTYRPADFNSEFQKVATRTVTVNASLLTIAVAGPAKTVPGDDAAYEITYENMTDAALSGVKVRATYGAGFVPKKFEPETEDPGRAEWVVDKLDPGTKGVIKVTGSYASDVQGTQEMGAEVALATADDPYVLQNRAGALTEVLQGDLLTALVLNGKSEVQPVGFGDTLRYAVTYRNTSSSTLGDVVISVVLDQVPGRIVDWSKLVDAEKGIRDGDRLTWTKKQIGGLEKIAPGEEGSIAFDVPVIAAPLPQQRSTDYSVTAQVQAAVGTIDGDDSSRKVTSQQVVAKVQSDAAFTTDGRYFSDDGEPLGSGPLPPTVGQTTTYRITWTLKNSFHDLADIKATAKLPSGVSWTGKSDVDAGDLTYDASTGKMVWTLNWMPTTVTALSVSFDVAISPTAAQTGKIPTLTETALFQATDKVTTQPLLISRPPITTAIEDDAQASGKGRVVAAE
jgi:hypothetical protein